MKDYRLEIIHPTYGVIAIIGSPDVPRKGDNIEYNKEVYVVTNVTWILPITELRHVKLTIEELCT
jgi:hypothetical protein